MDSARTSSVDLRRLLVTVLAILALASCGEVPLEDVSSSAQYSKLIGRSFKTKEDLLLIGVTTDNQRKRVDYFVLVTPPGFANRWVVTKEQLEKESVLRVVQVLKSTVPFISRVEYVVEIRNDRTSRQAPIRVRQTGPADDGNYGLDERIFKKVE